MADLEELIRKHLAEEAEEARFGRWTMIRFDPVRRPRSLGLTLRTRRLATWLAAAALIVAAVGLPLTLLSGLGDGRSIRPASTTVEGAGLHMEIPPGWDGRVLNETTFGPTLQAASRPIMDAPDDDLLDVHLTETRRLLVPGEVALVLIDYTEVRAGLGFQPGHDDTFPPLEGTPSIGPSDLQPSFEGVPPDHAFYRRTFTLHQRSFDLWVEFGSAEAPPALIGQVNETLATLRVGTATASTEPTQLADVDDGVSIQIPSGWTFREDPVPNLGDPRILFAAGSWSFPEGGECGPDPALTELPDDGVFLWLLEYVGRGSLEGFPDRPASFQFPEEEVRPECSGVRPQYLLFFQEAGRYFQIHVAFGRAATETTRQEALHALDSIEVTAPVPEGCPADTGPWSDPDCPEQAWVHQVVTEAGYEVTGETGSALVARGLGGEFDVWAFVPEGGPITAEDLAREGYRGAWNIEGTQVYSDGVRATWTAQGLQVWVAGWMVGEPAPGEPPPGPIVAELAKASNRVDYDAVDTR